LIIEMPVKKIYFPANLDIEKILIENPPENISSPKSDVCLKLISNIYENYVNNYKKNEKNSYVNIPSTELRKINRAYNRYLRYLEERNIIEIIHHYEPGKYCKSYRIHPHYYSSGIRSLSIDQPSQNWKGYDNLKGTYKILADWFSKISIDWYSASTELDNLKENDYDRYIRYYITLENFQHKNFFFKKMTSSSS